MQWFEVSREGLAKLLARKGKCFALYELIQNALDEETRKVDVELTRVAGTRNVTLRVCDDSPGGFADLTHAFTLFAESAKKSNVSARGRFNAGEKMVLALCNEARIASTTGTIIFNEEGRGRSRAKTERGSIFEGVMRMTSEEMQECEAAVKRILVPEGVELKYNGQVIPSREPICVLEASLQTEVADEEGFMRKAIRKTELEIFEVMPDDDGAMIFEMGIPVMPTADRYHVNVRQKVPLSMERDAVPPAYLAKVRALVLEAMCDKLQAADATSTWAKDAVERHGDDMKPETIAKLVELRFGSKCVSFDPSDPEANRRAVSEGFVVVHGSQLSGKEWGAIRSAGALLPAGKVTPSAKPFSENGEALRLVAPREWTQHMVQVVAYAKRLAPRLMGVEIEVQIANDVTWPFAATYGQRLLTINLGRVGHRWFEGGLESINDLLLHEFGHQYQSDHLSPEYYKALTKLGARLATLALEEPGLFELEQEIAV